MLGKYFEYARRRLQKGNSLSEFGPAMWILLLCIFLPMLNIMSLAVSYMLCLVLNFNQVHEAALLPSADAASAAGIVKKKIPDQWMSGMGQFTNISGYPTTDVGYRKIVNSATEIEKVVVVRTTVKCNPFLAIPLPVANVPGINAPIPFVLCSESPVENPDYAGDWELPPIATSGGRGGAGRSRTTATTPEPPKTISIFGGSCTRILHW